MKNEDSMKIGAIIAEYNIFHNGHKYQIDEFKKKYGITHVVAIISGNFVQRGGPSILDKYTKTRACLENGIDLVLEIPTIFSTQSAEIFSRGSVITLDSMSCIDYLCFGSEVGDISKLETVANYIDTESYRNSLKSYLDAKNPFPVAREKAIFDGIGIDGSIVNKPNNILAIEYIRSLNMVSSTIKPVTVQRVGVDHDSYSSESIFRSATSLRKDIIKIYNKCDTYINKKNKSFFEDNKQKCIKNDIIKMVDLISPYIPFSTRNEIISSLNSGVVFMDENTFMDEIFYSIMDKGLDNIRDVFEVIEGIENSVLNNVMQSVDITDIVSRLTNKRYSSSKIRRMMYNIFLNIKKEDVRRVMALSKTPYIRILGLNKNGGEIIRKIKNNSDVYIIDKPSRVYKEEAYKKNDLFRMMYDLDIKASNMYYKKYYSKRSDILKKGEIDLVTSPIYSSKQ